MKLKAGIIAFIALMFEILYFSIDIFEVGGAEHHCDYDSIKLGMNQHSNKEATVTHLWLNECIPDHVSKSASRSWYISLQCVVADDQNWYKVDESDCDRKNLKL